jgi:hypothetical protein
MRVDRCPICLGDLDLINRTGGRDAFEITCRTCGEFVCSGTFLSAFPAVEDQLRPYLSAYTRQQFEAGNHAEVDTGNWKALAEPHFRTGLQQKLEKLLRVIERHSTGHGAWVKMDLDHDYPLIDAAAWDQLKYFLDEGVRTGCLESHGDPWHFRLTPRGWDKLYPMQDDLGAELRRSGLAEAESILAVLKKSADAFEQRDFNGCLANARIGLETLGRSVANARGSGQSTWGQALAYLRQAGVITEHEEKGLAGIYQFVSPGAHRPMQNSDQEKALARLGRKFAVDMCYFLARRHNGTI